MLIYEVYIIVYVHRHVLQFIVLSIFTLICYLRGSLLNQLSWLLFCQEGSNHDRGLYARCFEELFDLANSDSTSTSRFSFSLSVFEIYNEQVLPIESKVLILLAFIFFTKIVLQWNLTCLIRQFSLSDQGSTFGNSEQLAQDQHGFTRICYRTWTGKS